MHLFANLQTKQNRFYVSTNQIKANETHTKPNLSIYSPYYAETCNEFAVPISAS